MSIRRPIRAVVRDDAPSPTLSQLLRPDDWTASKDPKPLARTFGFLVTEEGLREVAGYADGIGPWKRRAGLGLPGLARERHGGGRGGRSRPAPFRRRFASYWLPNRFWGMPAAAKMWSREASS
ncbi:MAG: hypothetical protein DME03_02310 [Candidatus Rokuibacteriota bacterium]|nr:MAG: hypothetical protein DME03_02310 [Candidatus Rokubacteria bacterium]